MATVDPQNTRVLSCIKDLWSWSCGFYQTAISKSLNWHFIALPSASANDLWQYLRSASWLCVLCCHIRDLRSGFHFLSHGKNVGVPGKQHDAAKNIKVGQLWISIFTWELFFYELLCCSPLCVVPLVWSHHRGDVVGTSQSTTKMAIATTLQNSEYFPIYFYFLNRKKIWYIIHKHIFKVQDCKKT